MTLGNAAAARVRLIVWCRHCGRQVEPDPAEMAGRYGAEKPFLTGTLALFARDAGADRSISWPPEPSDSRPLGASSRGPPRFKVIDGDVEALGFACTRTDRCRPVRGEPGRSRRRSRRVATEAPEFLSAEECRAHAVACERMARSPSTVDGLRETLIEVAEQWRQLAQDAEARAKA